MHNFVFCNMYNHCIVDIHMYDSKTSCKWTAEYWYMYVYSNIAVKLHLGSCIVTNIMVSKSSNKFVTVTQLLLKLIFSIGSMFDSHWVGQLDKIDIWQICINQPVDTAINSEYKSSLPPTKGHVTFYWQCPVTSAATHLHETVHSRGPSSLSPITQVTSQIILTIEQHLTLYINTFKKSSNLVSMNDLKR